MNTTPINNKNSKDKKWTKAGIAAAVAAGAITVEAANLLYAQLAKEENNDNGADTAADEVQTATAEPEHDVIAEAKPEPVAEPVAEPVVEPISDPEAEDNTQEPETRNEDDHRPEREATPEKEDIADNTHTPNDDDLVDIIVEEIDPQDVEMDDVVLVDGFGTVYTEDGEKIDVAYIHDSEGNEGMMADIDGDNVYDVIATPQGDVVANIDPMHDIDKSDAEVMYAQQHGDTGFMEQNEFDIAMNEETPEVEDNMSLT